MPCTSLFGRELRQLSTDNVLFYFMVAVVQVIWLIIYSIGVAAFSRPEDCEPGTESGSQVYAMVFALLGFFVSQAALCCAAVLLTLRGTPLEPSRRRGVPLLSYAYLASLPLNAGLLAWGGYVVEAGDGSCWSSDNKRMAATIVFGGIGVLLGQAVGIMLTYNQLGDVDPGVWWHEKTRTGLSRLAHLLGQWDEPHRGPAAQLEEMATALQRLMSCVGAEKTDAVAGLACAALVQAEAADAGAAVARAQAVCVEAQPQGSSSDSQLLQWAEGVCSGTAAACGESVSTPADAEPEAVAEALHWARFAAAAYGARQVLWRRGKRSARASRKQLAAAAAAAAAASEAPLAGWCAVAGGSGSSESGKAPSGAAMLDYVAAMELLGDGADIVWFSCGHEKRGVLPHLVAVDREHRSVVLGIAGDWQQPHAVPHVQPVPPAWLASSSNGDHGGSVAQQQPSSPDAAQVGAHAGNAAASAADGSTNSSSWAHGQSLAAAEVLLQELEGSQLLQALLRSGGVALPQSGTPGLTAALTSKGLDCSGWRLVLAGHGTGAGVAALLALALRRQHPCLEVWAFAPPGQLCSAKLAAELGGSCNMTSVVTGDDAAPRATYAALDALVEQSLVGLARLRYCKAGLFAALLAERFGPARWQGRWLRASRALRPVAQVPPEALTYLQRYRTWRQAQRPGPRCSLPGRVLLLSRLPREPAAAEFEGLQPGTAADGDGDAKSSRSSRSTDSGSGQRWRAAWVTGEALEAGGLPVSRHALSDHRVSRLLSVLGDLAAACGGAPLLRVHVSAV